MATGIPWQNSVDGAKEVGRILSTKANGVVGVGYCLRYLKAVQQMKKMIEDEKLNV